MPIVTRGSSAELPEIMPVMKMAFDPRYGEAWTELQCLAVLGMPGSSLFLARDEGVVGFALSRTIADSCELLLVAVHPAERGRGIGRALLDEVIVDASIWGALTVFLEMRANNLAAGLYSSAGFVEVGRRRSYYRGTSGEVFDALTYRREMT